MTNIEKLIGRMGWQPIDENTPAKTLFFVKCKEYCTTAERGRYELWHVKLGNDYVYNGEWNQEMLFCAPTHFMPIPTGKEGKIMLVLYEALKTYKASVNYEGSLADLALAKAEELAGEV